VPTNKENYLVIISMVILIIMNSCLLAFIFPLPGINILGFILEISIILYFIYFLIRRKISTAQTVCGLSLIIGISFFIGGLYLYYERNISHFPKEEFKLPVILAVGLILLSCVLLTRIKKY